MERIERLVAITFLLQARGRMTAQRLGEVLGVSVRTIYRDITALSLAHVPVAMEYGPGGGYYLPDDYHLDPSAFTREEAVSLILSADIAGNHSFFAGDDDLHRALIKLEATLPEEYRICVQNARDHILFDTTAWVDRTHTVYLDTIRSAVLERRVLDVLYSCLTCKTRNGLEWRHVEPYGLVFKALSRRHARVGIWYLVAHCLCCGHFRTFRLGHIEDVRIGADRFVAQPDFDLQAYWKEARKQLEEPVILKLHVDARARRKLSGNLTLLEEDTDGSLTVEVEVGGFEDAVSYVLGLGAAATVLAPEQVQRAVADTARAIAQMYG